MRGELVDAVLFPEAEATNSTTERASDPTSNQRKYSRELKGLTDRRHFQHHPRHDSVFAHWFSTTASMSTSAAPSTTHITVGSTNTDVGIGLEMVPRASFGDEEPGSGSNPRLRNRRDTLDDNWSEEREAAAVRGSCRTRSQIPRTAPPETTDPEGVCTECKIRVRTDGARDCAR